MNQNREFATAQRRPPQKTTKHVVDFRGDSFSPISGTLPRSSSREVRPFSVVYGKPSPKKGKRTPLGDLDTQRIQHSRHITDPKRNYLP